MFLLLTVPFKPTCFNINIQKAGGAVLYVPECTGDGRYARAQCYKTTGYCWCVHQDTGKPIPGSSVKDSRPDCDATLQHASPMRGAPTTLTPSIRKANQAEVS